MAVTKGHGNPRWTRDEVILALELYHHCDGKIPGVNDIRVCKLSDELRSFPYHLLQARESSFRNPDSILFKLQNLRAVDKGAGLKNTSKIDREVWLELGWSRELTSRLASDVRRRVETMENLPKSYDEEEFSEGKAATALHVRRERSAKLRKEFIRIRLKSEKLLCDICRVDGYHLDPDIRDSMFECHHVLPLSIRGESNTKISEMALLCANCHRLLHRAMAVRSKWLSIEEAREIIKK
ncbi:HNH endonuclease [Pseudomonas juntendi]|uniref:HNH endonuclease n=1 Tax=Pseudomonas monteilii TaxID=76759 RepID=A0A7X3F5Y6_9PSED|nr:MULTISPECIES: HNH endonuclease [Pseudomonas]MDH2015024.1 HNH endonuclease [Pseudomonas juntendi]MVF51774.1 HNH endonuclease [Pseudomonas monteilii]